MLTTHSGLVHIYSFRLHFTKSIPAMSISRELLSNRCPPNISPKNNITGAVKRGRMCHCNTIVSKNVQVHFNWKLYLMNHWLQWIALQTRIQRVYKPVRQTKYLETTALFPQENILITKSNEGPTINIILRVHVYLIYRCHCRL